MTEVEILSKLEGVFAQEGLVFEILGREDQRLLVRARRTGPGAPVAFMVKALEGTLRHYHTELREVELVEYDPGEGKATPESPSPELDKIFKHQSPLPKMRLPEVPGLDLRGTDRTQAMRALEQAQKMWSRQGIQRFKVMGLGEDAPRRALDKWLSFFELAQSVQWMAGGDVACIALKGSESEEFPEEETMWFPARLMLIGG